MSKERSTHPLDLCVCNHQRRQHSLQADHCIIMTCNCRSFTTPPSGKFSIERIGKHEDFKPNATDPLQSLRQLIAELNLTAEKLRQQLHDQSTELIKVSAEREELRRERDALREFVGIVARMKTAEEYADDEMDGDDACATLSELIVSARKL